MGENQKFKEHGVKHLWVKIKSSRNKVSKIYGVENQKFKKIWCQTFMGENLKFCILKCHLSI